MTDKLEILVVEDREENISAAKNYFSKMENVLVDYAKDYTEAITNLESKKYNGVISDIFFPQTTGSEERQLGKKLIYTLAKEYLASNEAKEASESLANYEKFVGIDKFPEFISSGDKYGIDFGSLTELYKNLEKDSSNQPLGLLIADEAKKKGTKIVLATSLNHHHASAQPAMSYGWTRKIEICEANSEGDYTKSSADFWQSAFKRLMGERR